MHQAALEQRKKGTQQQQHERTGGKKEEEGRSPQVLQEEEEAEMDGGADGVSSHGDGVPKRLHYPEKTEVGRTSCGGHAHNCSHASYGPGDEDEEHLQPRLTDWTDGKTTRVEWK